MLVLNEQNKVKKHQERNNDGGKKTPNKWKMPHPWTVPGQAGWHSEQPGRVGGVPAHGKGGGIR